jgi:transposase-like protein
LRRCSEFRPKTFCYRIHLYGFAKSCNTTDFLLSATQDAEAAKRFLSEALGWQNHPTPRVIHTDGHGAYPPAIAQLKSDGVLDETCRHRVGRCLNNLVEQDHRAIKRRVKASQHFRSFWGAWHTLAGYEAVHMLRKRPSVWKLIERRRRAAACLHVDLRISGLIRTFRLHFRFPPKVAT